MARIVITRPNGETEYAELTTNKAQAGNDCLTVNKDGTTYYAKLDNGVSTHMFVIKPDGRKLYVQKEIFTWKYQIDGKWDNASKMVIPRTGKYKLTYKRITHRKIRYSSTTEERIEIGYDIFEQGAKFIEQRKGFFTETIIKSRTGRAYYYNHHTIIVDGNGKDIENETEYLLEIEYIGEA